MREAQVAPEIRWRVRFDDTLQTVLTTDLSHAQARQSAWRQLIDLIGRRRASADPRALALLADIRDAVPQPIRAASARALVFANPPAELVRLLAQDTLAVAAPVLASARLDAGEWTALLPELTPSTRSVLRNRRDLPAEVERALASFGPADMVLTDQSSAGITVLEEPEDAVVQAPEPPLSLTPAESASVPAVRTEEPPAPQPEPAAIPQGPFRIVDVVARINAFQRQAENRPRKPAFVPGVVTNFRFETDSHGVLCRVEGVERGPLIGLPLSRTGALGLAELDSVASGAFRRRAAFSNARLRVGGSSDANGDWRISGVPVFDPGSGRFTGYRGSARRPRPDEHAEPVQVARNSTADTLRQLVHELRTPAGAISSFAEMIEAEMLGPVPPVYRAQAGVIRQEARDLLGVIDDLDLAARIEEDALDLRPDAVALAPLLAEIAGDLAALAELRGAALVIEQAASIVRGDRRAVERLLARLLTTLVSAATRGETIQVEPLDAGAEAARLSFSLPAAFDAYPGDALFAIDDEGEEAALLGTGFAMRLVRNLARELGGALLFERNRVILQLPVPEAVPLGQAHGG
ncbi:sensor histidine kinase [Sphingomonas sp. PL-96]|uniref:histidine kinase dimerization/phospho-acceptor domain-containing protein n=1 Tax=Sphingomonas sp. PL-96 TaxID=2887201 RepID=UPI001E454285|nr:histidine kinase dimerization/phospho-acceptor domain-containing protein [Sphingomonas sp. PL-96]MCC2976724.1 sensor histidine kinase [Sphingomonas sp. PL-96]